MNTHLAAEQFEFLTEAVAANAAIVAADRVGVLARIERGAVGASTLGRELSLDERSTRWLMASLASLGIIARGDLFSLDLGQTAYDLAIADHFCHLFDELTNCNLLARWFDALVPEGRVAIIDVLPNEEMTGPREAILYGLGLLLRTSPGQAYRYSCYTDWLHNIGFEDIECVRLASALPSSLSTARRRANPPTP